MLYEVITPALLGSGDDFVPVRGQLVHGELGFLLPKDDLLDLAGLDVQSYNFV